MTFAAGYYARYRPGYPPPVIDRLVADLGLTGESTVLDLGCGTGLLTLALAGRVRLVVGADPEPDMLRQASKAANAVCLVAGDRDLPALAALFRPDAITIAQALHLMDLDRVLAGAAGLLAPGGRLAVVANGTPLWQQETEWSRVLLRHTRARLGPGAGRNSCGTSDADRAAYRARIEAAGYTGVVESTVERDHVLSVDEVVGGLFSALGPDQVEELAGTAFEHALRAELTDLGELTEHVRVRILSAAPGHGTSRAYSSSSTGRPSP